MTQEEFYQKIFKPIYVQAALKELVSQKSAEANFEDFREKVSFFDMRNFLIYKIFLWNLSGPEVEELRNLEITDFSMGLEEFFN